MYRKYNILPACWRLPILHLLTVYGVADTAKMGNTAPISVKYNDVCKFDTCLYYFCRCQPVNMLCNINSVSKKFCNFAFRQETKSKTEETDIRQNDITICIDMQ